MVLTHYNLYNNPGRRHAQDRAGDQVRAEVVLRPADHVRHGGGEDPVGRGPRGLQQGEEGGDAEVGPEHHPDGDLPEEELARRLQRLFLT